MSTRTRVVRQAAASCLTYPDAELVARAPVVRAALREQRVSGFDAVLDLLERCPLPELEQRYVEVFDLSRRHALYLSYWTDGDTRRRGEVLGRFKAAYRASGFLVDTRGELPDYLPMVLEFAATVDPDVGEQILREYRPSLELLRIGLVEDATPSTLAYGQVVAAVCATLPGASPADRAAVQAMVDGPPAELVGLEPYDPRLLPLSASNAGGR
nr:nitrate reductase molybdenum cofactor assembly chaperone [Cellulomonas sp. HZM]